MHGPIVPVDVVPATLFPSEPARTWSGCTAPADRRDVASDRPELVDRLALLRHEAAYSIRRPIRCLPPGRRPVLVAAAPAVVASGSRVDVGVGVRVPAELGDVVWGGVWVGVGVWIGALGTPGAGVGAGADGPRCRVGGASDQFEVRQVTRCLCAIHAGTPMAIASSGQVIV